MSEPVTPEVIHWLMAGDPVIRWQTMRDLCGCTEDEWRAERGRVALEGWGAQFLANQLPNGEWPAGRWTDTVWTLLTLMDCGMPPDHSGARDSARAFIDRNLTTKQANDDSWLQTRIDLCHLGFWLRIGAYFCPDDARLPPLANGILRMQMPDGGWNCRMRRYPQTRHSSFHTTFNVLEGLQAASDADIVPAQEFRRSELRAIELMLAHQMYRSDRTGEIIHERFTDLTFPSHWHYTMLRGLDYLRAHPAIADTRLQDPIALLVSRQRPSGRWPVEKRIPGVVLFEMEKMGGDSRWNTLRALRTLRRRQAAT
ncbi:hypothetical protein CCAX7_41770 [Capsulimonas corticalis]|uniref:Uncharacterized protein n=1 Tax=Capsulimonas corticalis TaxID=2219043 RepID=A0A402CY20_9BACT|nr:hypothetical protein [Capsulimonas corticalis]BDI32126.1 hypothetical protein CCAX7_41770 [Capsulimonas corticalis]